MNKLTALRKLSETFPRMTLSQALRIVNALVDEKPSAGDSKEIIAEWIKTQPEIMALINGGKVIQGIKEVRSAIPGMNLYDAKQAVDFLRY